MSESFKRAADEVIQRLSTPGEDLKEVRVLQPGNKELFDEGSITTNGAEHPVLGTFPAPKEPGQIGLVFDLTVLGLNHAGARSLAAIQADLDAYPDAPWRGPSQRKAG